MDFLESLSNEEPGFSVTICCPGYIKTEFDQKKVVGDGSIQDLKIVIDESKYQTPQKAASLLISGIEKKKLKYHLTNQGSVGTKLHQLFPSFINNTVKSEMQKN